MSVLLGIDPGFASIGYAALELKTNKVLEFGLLRSKKANKKQRLLAVEDNLRRAIDIATSINELLSHLNIQYSVNAICAEAMSFPRNASVAAKVSMCWGIMADISANHGVEILQVSPQEVKKAVYGAKNATKEDIQRVLQGLYPETTLFAESIPRTLHEHPFDALAVLVSLRPVCLRRLGMRE